MITDIVQGHINEIFKREQELSDSRLAICKTCPLYLKTPVGYICDNAKWVNPQTNEYRYNEAPGFFKGCNCRLQAKTRLPDAFCPARKW